MIRRLATLAGVVSLLLCVATVVLWVRDGSITLVTSHAQYGVRCDQDVLVLAALRSTGDDGDLGWYFNDSTKDHVVWWGIRYFYMRPSHGFLFDRWSDPPFTASVLYLPVWFASLLTAGLPAWWVARRVMEGRRQDASHCQRCGYDLRATSGRCPECGAVPAAPAAR